MKMKLVIIASLVALSTSAFAAAPKCVNIGTRSEGWKLPSGQLIKTKCKGYAAFCDAIGTKSEGWYTAAVRSSKLIKYDNCIADGMKAPVCVNIGTRSEGWRLKNGTLIFANCAKKIAACFDGSRSEGWYAVTIKRPKRLLQWTKCS